MSVESKLDRVRQCVAAIAQDPHSDVIFELVRLYRELGLDDAAFDAVRNWFAQNPDSVDGELTLGTLYVERGGFDEARSLFERVMEREASNPSVWLKLIELEIKQRHLQLAKQKISEFRQQFTDVDELEAVEEKLSSLAEEMSNVEGGNGPSIVTSTMADLYFRQGLAEKSLAMYRQLLNREPDNPLYKNRIEQIMSEDGRARSFPEVQQQKTTEVLTRWLTAIDRRRKHV